MRTIRSLLFLIAVGILIAACGGSAAAPILNTVGNAIPDDNAKGNGLGAIPAASAGGAPAPAEGQGNGGGQIAAVDEAKIIRTGTMDLEVSDVPAALHAARDAITGLGGYLGASTTSNEGDRPSAEITYRIPAPRWEQALDLMRGLNGLTTKVVTEHTDAIEVTSQVIDLQARITNLRASESALQAIAARATKISDVLEVQAQLTDTRGQIETLTAQLKDLNDRAGYATLTVRFNVPIVAVELAKKSWEPTTVVDEASAATVSILQNLATAGIWFVIVWLPVLLIFGAIVLVMIAIARRLGYGRRTPTATPPAPLVEG